MEYSSEEAALIAKAIDAMKISNNAYTPEFWSKLESELRKSNARYERECRAMCIDPISGRSTMSAERRNRMFDC